MFNKGCLSKETGVFFLERDEIRCCWQSAAASGGIKDVKLTAGYKNGKANGGKRRVCKGTGNTCVRSWRHHAICLSPLVLFGVIDN